MAAAVYILGALTTLVCALLLLNRYREVRLRLLLWSGLCFVGLTVSNVLLCIDLLVVHDIDLYVERLASAAIGMSLLVYGLIWESG